MPRINALSGSSRVNKRIDFLLPFPDYPSNARCFVHMDARLLPYWHTLFDVCPGLLKLDPPDGLNLFRDFMKWAYRNHPPLDWTYHLSVCRWLLGSVYKSQIIEEHIESFMTASVARWVNIDDSQAQGIVVLCQQPLIKVFDWKVAPRFADACPEQEELPPSLWDFAWCPLARQGGTGFRRWLPIANNQ